MSSTPPTFDGPVRSILFVCLGNICRSPLAEGVLRHRAEERGLLDRIEIDSAGTGAWHVGEPPDARSAEVARRNGVRLEGRARKLGREDLRTFDLILAMDRENLEALHQMAGGEEARERIRLLREFDPEPGDRQVPDPYYGGPDGFDRVFEMVDRSTERLLDQIEASHERSGEAP